MHFVKFLPRYLQQSVMKMQNLIKLGKNCKNILFRDNHLPFIQEQLMEKIKVNYKLAPWRYVPVIIISLTVIMSQLIFE